MKIREFRALVEGLGRLTPRQKGLLSEGLRKIKSAQETNDLLESRVVSKPVCPRCGCERIARWGTASRLQRYRCADCKSTFNALTGTPLARLRHKDKWSDYAQQMAEGKSIRKSAAHTGVHRNTSFRWRHRFLTLPAQQKAKRMVGIVEADETFFLESFKGKKQGMVRKPRKRGGKASKRGVSNEQVPVLICRDRTGSTSDFVLPKADKKHICAALKPIVAADAVLCTDGSKAARAASRSLGIVHRSVNLSAGIRVVDKVYHVQNVNAYDSRLKTWIRRFNGVATHYLPSYLGWQRLNDRTKAPMSSSIILSAALGIDKFNN